MVTRARVDRLRQAADEQRRRRDAAPDTSGLGELTRRDEWTKTYRDTDQAGTVTSVLVTRGGTALRVTGACLDCVTGAADCDRCPVRPGPRESAGPQPTPGNPWAPEQPPDDEPPPEPMPAVPTGPAGHGSGPEAAMAMEPQPAGTHPAGTAPQPDQLAAIAADRWSKSL